MMAARVTKRKKIIFSGGVHPHYVETARTACEALGLEIVALPAAVDDEAAVSKHLGADVAAVIVQSPNLFGTVTDLAPISEAAHGAGALMVATFTECVAFGLIEPGAPMARISSAAKANRSAMRSISAGHMWACSA